MNNYNEHKIKALLEKSKPDTHFDISFSNKLRAELMGTAMPKISSPYASTFFASRIFYGVIGSALTVLFVVPLTFIATQKATSPEKPVVLNPFSAQIKDLSSGLTPKQQISNKGIDAFGKLALIPTPEPATTTVAATAAVTATTTPALVAVKDQDSVYGYSGDQITLQEANGKVFKRTKGIDSNTQLGNIIQNGKFNLTDFSNFIGLSLKNIELTENKADGYTISVDFDEGAIEINSASVGVSTSTDADATLLTSVSNQFVKDHNIDMTVYDAPVVQGQNTVVYPLKLDGKEVYEEDGSSFGLTVVVNPEQKKVVSVSNLTSQTYDSSQYALETNFNTVVTIATSALSQSSTSTNEANLGMPKAVLMHSGDLFIPALLFPIKYPEKVTGMNSVVVPLVKDFLTKWNPFAKP